VIVIGFALAFIAFERRHQQGEAARGGDGRPEKPAVAGITELETLSATFLENEARADDQFTNRRVTCEGCVARVEKLASGGYRIDFIHGISGNSLVACAFFPASESSKLAKLEYRSPVWFTGRCDGWDKSGYPAIVAIRDCKVTDPPKVKLPAKDEPKVDPKKR
jgi:hypothetical protein